MSNKPIFDKVLIANRGEIACRVIRTCRRMGIKTVAIYSTADERARHVAMADEAVCVGPPTSKLSYLRMDAVLDAVLKTKANAVHPGYGFLSENSEFSALLAKNNVTFIGPDAHSIENMGDKINSKRLAEEAKVNTIPGFIGEITSHQQLLDMAHQIGYPVMVKASGGGGGKGMRVATNDKECVEFFDLCKEEAMSAFNNDKMLVEKFIESPRHIEIQVMADRHGNTLYFPERECSIQRRNQKVLEEAPSMLIDDATRRAMGEQAAAMARKVQYVCAGTVEMVVDPKRNFYFLEMNTRLQVEHPITELITGVDLVEQMIRASAGLPLSIKQEDIKINGWATEARVYAEDPLKKFFPSIGRLTQYDEPRGVEGVRCDSGIIEGSQISVYYDPLIAKLCTWGANRNQCLDRMEQALDSFVTRGVRHNICLLRDVIGEKNYRDGTITTKYLDETYPDGFKKAAITPTQRQRLFAATAMMRMLRDKNSTLHGVLSRDEDAVAIAARPHEYSVAYADGTCAQTTTVRRIDGETSTSDATFAIDVAPTAEGAPAVSGEFSIHWDIEFPRVLVTTTKGFGLAEGAAPLKEVLQYWGTDEVTYHIQYAGSVFAVNVADAAQAALMKFMPPPRSGASQFDVLSPMPGVIVGLAVQPGTVVVAGTVLCTLEAMKMRNQIRAEVDGTVKSVSVSVGQTVEEGALLVQFEHPAKDKKE